MIETVNTYYGSDQSVDEVVDKYQARPDALIMILQDVQRHYRYLPEDALKSVAEKMNLPLAQIYGVATYYRSFSLKPKGKNHICACTGTACHVRLAQVIVEKLETELGVRAGETTPDMEFSLETVNCLGACALGPLVTANEVYYGNMNVTKVDRLLAKLRGQETVDRKAEEEAA